MPPSGSALPGILRGKTLVVVVVAVEHHVDAGGVENLPKTLHTFDAGTIRPRSEQRVVEVGKGTRLLFVGGEVLLEPPTLGRARTAAEHLTTVAVEGDEVPASQVVGVVTFVGIASCSPEVVEVASGPFGAVLVVAGAGPGAILE